MVKKYRLNCRKKRNYKKFKEIKPSAFYWRDIYTCKVKLPDKGNTAFAENRVIIAIKPQGKGVNVHTLRRRLAFVVAIPGVSTIMHFFADTVENLEGYHLYTGLTVDVELVVFARVVGRKRIGYVKIGW